VHPDDLIEVDGEAHTVSGHGTPSAETRLHLTVIAAREARAVLHSHSLWNTILSAEYCATGVVEIAGYELLKGLSGVTTHEHRERIPVLRNSQDMRRLSDELADVLDREPAAHGFLLAGHGLYTWGASLSEARRHLEALEFLLQVVGTRLLLPRGRCSQAEN
jgi:methylthioribulose-1-phosphate dehydratase